MSADGRGVLLYPYYTTRSDGAGNAYDAGVGCEQDLVGKSGQRQILGKQNSRQVFGQFIPVPIRRWTAAILPNRPPPAPGSTVDRSCGCRHFPLRRRLLLQFRELGLCRGKRRRRGHQLDRTKEGHFRSSDGDVASGSVTTRRSHVNGVPPCGNNLSDLQAGWMRNRRGGGLFDGDAHHQFRNSYSFDAIGLANFFRVGSTTTIGTSLPPLIRQRRGQCVFAPDGSL